MASGCTPLQARSVSHGNVRTPTEDRLPRSLCRSQSTLGFILAESRRRRDAIRACFENCNAEALHGQSRQRAALYARLKLAGLDDAPCQFAVFADRATVQGHGLGRLTMPSTLDYSAVLAVHTLWLAARAEGIGLGWVSILDPAVVASMLGGLQRGLLSDIFA